MPVISTRLPCPTPPYRYCGYGGWSDAGWVARRRPLAGPLSPRGSQPALTKLRGHFASPNGSVGLAARVRGLQYKSSLRG